MKALLGRHHPLNGSESWRNLGDFLWESNNGVRFVIFSDIVISLTTLENKIMHALAAKHLEAHHNICLHRNSPQFGGGFKPENLFASMKKALQSNNSPVAHIFGMSLKAASKDERMRFGFRNIRINNQYKLHIPIFVLKSIKCIERFGLDMDSIFIKPGNCEKIDELRTKISNGLEYSFDNYFHVYEVADLLKTYFQMMPEGIFTDDLESRFLYTRELEISVRIRVLNLLVQMLPQINREALFLLMSLLYRITQSRWSQVSSRLLDIIFEPVLCRYNGNIVGEHYGVVQNLIDYFPAIFGLQNKHLNEIYKQMNIMRPRKMSIHLKRRSMQCNDESSDIFGSLKIFQTSTEEQFDMIHSQVQAANNLNMSTVRVPHPIRFNIRPFGSTGPSASLGRARSAAKDGPVRLNPPVRPIRPPPRIETTRRAESYKPVELARLAAVSGIDGIAGLAGPSGMAAPVGIAGLAGPSKLAALVGIAGLAGPSGLAAPVGIAELAGPSGMAAPVGTAGLAGPSGMAAPVGTAGLAGPSGLAAPVGIAGLAGPSGMAAPVGIAGLAGPSGMAAPVGIAGLAGPSGMAAPVGTAGLAGPSGMAAPVGIAGLAGPSGMAAPVGTAGLAGPSKLAKIAIPIKEQDAQENIPSREEPKRGAPNSMRL